MKENVFCNKFVGHIMERACKYLHYGTYIYREGSDWFVDIVMNLETNCFEFYLFNQQCDVKRFMKAVSCEDIDTEEDVIDQFYEKWEEEALTYESLYMRPDRSSEETRKSRYFPCGEYGTYRNEITKSKARLYSQTDVQDNSTDMNQPTNSNQQPQVCNVIIPLHPSSGIDFNVEPLFPYASQKKSSESNTPCNNPYGVVNCDFQNPPNKK